MLDVDIALIEELADRFYFMDGEIVEIVRRQRVAEISRMFSQYAVVFGHFAAEALANSLSNAVAETEEYTNKMHDAFLSAMVLRRDLDQI